MTKMIYLVMVCYSIPGSDSFRDFMGAAVGCWIKTELCDDQGDPHEFARKRLNAEGWHVVRIVLCEEVSSATYVDKSEGRDHFEQAELDGFVAHIHVYPREVIGSYSDGGDDISSSLVEVADTVAREGGYSLYDHREKQWAIGVTPEGSDFLPIWTNSKDAAEWLDSWPDHEIRHVEAEEIRSSEMLNSVVAAGMSIGLGIGKELLAMCVPEWLQEIAGKPDVVEALGGTKAGVGLTEEVRPRTGLEVPVCPTCEARFGRNV